MRRRPAETAHQPQGGVLVVGDVVTDVVAMVAGPVVAGSDTRATIRRTGGGAAANTAAWLATAGVPVTLVASVGDDADGRARVAELRAAGVRCALTWQDDAPTGTIVVLADSRDRTMVSDRGASLRLAARDVDAAFEAVPAATHLHLSGYVLLHPATLPAGRHALAAARRRGLTTSVDAASAAPLRQVGGSVFLEWVRGADVLFANLDEARALAGDGSAADLAVHLAIAVRHAVVKCGPDGAVYAGPDGALTTVPAEPARVVDATGAGDAFAAGMLAAWLAGTPLEESLTAGARLGARAISIVGARP